VFKKNEMGDGVRSMKEEDIRVEKVVMFVTGMCMDESAGPSGGGLGEGQARRILSVTLK